MMKDIRNLFVINSWQELLFKFATYFFVGTLPLFLNLNTIALGIFITSSLLSFKSHNGLYNIRKNFIVIAPLLMLFFLFVLGLCLSNNIHRVQKDIVRVIPLVLIPLSIAVHGKKNFNLQNVWIALGAGLLVGMVICWYNVCVSILSRQRYLEQASYFFEWIYTDWNLLKPLDGHPSYYAVLIVLFLSALIFHEDFQQFRRNRIKFILLLIPFLIFLLETSSRIGIIALFFIFFIYVVKTMKIKLAIYSFLLLSSIVVLAAKFDYLGSKFSNIINSNGEISVERIERWKEILDVFIEKDKYFIGVGSGDARLVYRRAYYNGGFDLALKENYNAHSQYLEFLVSNGIIGLLIYITCFLFFYRFTSLKGTALHIFICFVLFSISESFLGRSQGVMMFSFFYTIAVLQKN